MKQGITLHKINTNKFKTNLIAIFLTMPLERENVTKNAVLASILRRGCEKYKTQEEINKKLEERYGAEFDCGLDKIGKNHVLKFYIESVNDEFLPQSEENMLKQSFEVISEIALNPYVQTNSFNQDYLKQETGFNEEYINQEKQNVKQIIEAKKDNKAAYASFRCLEEMYKDMPEGLYRYGYVEDLDKIDAVNLYEYYKTVLNECKIDIFVSGKLDNINVEEIIEQDNNIQKLKEREPKYNINKPYSKQEPQEENIVQESMDVTQGKLVMGYDVISDDNMLEDKKMRYVGIIYNAILGGSATSKMFQNVREKASLAYTASSNYSYYYNNIFATAGIEIENFEKAVDIIKQQVDAMKNGDFTDEDISNAKNVLKSNIATISDEQDTEIVYYLGQALSGNNVSVDEYIKFINDVNKEEINNFAQKVKLNTIYFLKN